LAGQAFLDGVGQAGVDVADGFQVLGGGPHQLLEGPEAADQFVHHVLGQAGHLVEQAVPARLQAEVEAVLRARDDDGGHATQVA
jgi:hypothetical protein